MKSYMKNLMGIVALLLTLSMSAFGQNSVQGVFNLSSTGTTSATVVVPASDGYANVTDLTYTLDAAVTTGTLFIRPAIDAKRVTSTTVSSASVIYISNPSNGLAASTHVIFLDGSTGTHYLRRIIASSTTSVTLNTALGIASTANEDTLYICGTTVQKPLANTTSPTSGGINLWLPSRFPTALTLDGNTTACVLEASGVRSEYR